MKKIFGEENLSLLKEIGKIAQKENLTAYLVGGPVRDLFFKKVSKDLDIVVSARGETKKDTAINLAKELFWIWQKKEKRDNYLRGDYLKFKIYQNFGTATIFFPKLQVDFAFSRKEKYAYPGALPGVAPGDIQNDLYRRDFTINALAIDLSPNNFGKLVDPTGGEDDLKKGLIRVLHRQSFLDDPTRILRAARFAGRYDFQIEKKTLVWLKEAIKKNAFSTISRERFREEMITILKEKEVARCLGFLANWNVLTFLHPSLSWSREQIAKIKFADTSENDWLVNLLLLIKNLNYRQSEEVARRMVLTRKEKKIILGTKKYLPFILKALKKTNSLRQIYSYFSKLPEEGLVYLGLSNPCWTKKIATFLERKRKASPVVSGEDLKKLGYLPGPIYKKILSKIFEYKLLGELPVGLPRKKEKEEEIKFIHKYFSWH